MSSPYLNGFPQIVLPLSIADWERLPRNPAYKYEYYDNCAVLTPRVDTRDAILRLASWQHVRLRSPLAIRAIGHDDWADLGSLFHSAFAGQLPFTCLSNDDGRTLAEACLKFTREGKDGKLFPQACLVARDNRGMVGAALVTLQSSARYPVEQLSADELQQETSLVPHLTWIFVHNFSARRGSGRALLQEVVRVLREAGHEYFASTFLVGNSTSTLWHWHMGFQLIPTGISQIHLEDVIVGDSPQK